MSGSMDLDQSVAFTLATIDASGAAYDAPEPLGRRSALTISLPELLDYGYCGTAQGIRWLCQQ